MGVPPMLLGLRASISGNSSASMITEPPIRSSACPILPPGAPILIRWFAYSGDPAAKDPYFLYGASNLGSLLSLFFYPAIMEPMTTLPNQTTLWLVGYIALAGLVMYCAYMISKVAPPDVEIFTNELP